jgi:hypothetical protein
MPRKPPTPITIACAWPLRSISTSLTSPIDSLFAPTTEVPISREASTWPGCCSVMTLAPALALDEAEPPGGGDALEPGAAGAPGLPMVPVVVAPGAGCIAGDPAVVEPEPEAVGRSVPPDGGGVCASAGAAASAVATKQAAMCFFSIESSS